MDVRLFTIPGSHPGSAIELMLKAKGIEYARTDLIPVISKPLLRVLGFPGITVPAAKIKGKRVQGSIAIARELDRLQPEPRLYPEDQVARIEVEQIERFADDGLQHPIRQILWWGLQKNRSAMASYAEGAKLGVPVGLAVRTGAPIVALSVRLNRATDENVRDALAGLPGTLNRLDAWIEQGVIGGAQPNVADYQVAASIRLAMTVEDLRPALERRACGKLAMRIAPDFPGHLPPILPRAWLEPLRAEEPRKAASNQA